MPVTWITYKGKKILYGDYRGLKTMDRRQELIETLKQAFEEIKNSKEKVLVLSDFRDCNVGSEFMDLAKGDFPAYNIKKQVMIGVDGIKKILLNSFEKATGHIPDIFEDETEAKEFLIN